MTEWQASYQISTCTPPSCEKRGTPARTITLNEQRAGIVLEHPEFRAGYEEGHRQYERWHRHDTGITTSTLLFLVRNGWGAGTSSDLWQTGYIVGWLFALFEHMTDQQGG
jgi:hypothetical protein